MPKEKKNEHKTKDEQWKRWDIHCIHPLDASVNPTSGNANGHKISNDLGDQPGKVIRVPHDPFCGMIELV